MNFNFTFLKKIHQPSLKTIMSNQFILNKFSEYQSWYQQGFDADENDEIDEIRRLEMRGQMGVTVMNFGTVSQKEWLVEFLSEYSSYEWNENLQKFE